MSRRRHYPTDPYDFNMKNRSRGGREHGIEYQDDSLSPIDSDDEENYLQKDKHGKMINYFRPKATGTDKIAPKDTDDTKERLTRLEGMLEQLVKRSSDSVAPPSHGLPAVGPQDKPHIVEKKPPQNKFMPERNEVEFALEPRNHHFTTSMWINKIQEISIRHNYNEKSTIQYMEKQMTGIIKAWYKSLPSHDFSWPEWKLLIAKTFPDNYEFITTLKRLVTRIKQADETMTNYYYSKMYLIEACRITGEDGVSCLIDGLNNHVIQLEAKAQNYLTPETLYSQYLISLPGYNVDYSPVSQVNPPDTTTAPPVNNWYYPNEGIQHDTSQQTSVFQYPQNDEPVNIVQSNFEPNFEPNFEYQQPNECMPFEPLILQGDMQSFEERGPVHARLGGKQLRKNNKHRRIRNRGRFEIGHP